MVFALRKLYAFLLHSSHIIFFSRNSYQRAFIKMNVPLDRSSSCLNFLLRSVGVSFPVLRIITVQKQIIDIFLSWKISKSRTRNYFSSKCKALEFGAGRSYILKMNERWRPHKFSVTTTCPLKKCADFASLPFYRSRSQNKCTDYGKFRHRMEITTGSGYAILMTLYPRRVFLYNSPIPFTRFITMMIYFST